MLPEYKQSVQSIYRTLGKSYNKHENITTLSRHLPKNERWFCKLVVKAFFKEGLLRHHRSDTYSWTEKGLRYAEAYLNSASGVMKKAKDAFYFSLLLDKVRDIAFPSLPSFTYYSFITRFRHLTL